MEKEINKLFPLEFQKLKKIEKKEQTKIINQFVDVELHQTTKFKPNPFYKPISKIVTFEI